jgi:hypothetical protein
LNDAIDISRKDAIILLVKHSLGNARASWSRKEILIRKIMIRRASHEGMSVNDARDSVYGYSRKIVVALEKILVEATRESLLRKGMLMRRHTPYQEER